MDDTENDRRDMLAKQREEGPLDREALIAKHNTEVYDTDELRELFEVKGFMAPFCVVKRKSDGKVGSLEFQHMPRFYYNFVEDK